MDVGQEQGSKQEEDPVLDWKNSRTGIGWTSNHIPTTNKWLRSSFGTRIKPHPLNGLSVVVLFHFTVAVFRPAQTNFTKAGNKPVFTSTGLNEVDLKTH